MKDLKPLTWTEERPWGRFKNILDLEYTKVKIIEVDPGKRLSYQSHAKRQESWTIAQGEAVVTLDDTDFQINTGENIIIPLGAKHRVRNRKEEKLVIIEVQTGAYFGEDDITRYEDDFGRTSKKKS